MVLLPQNRWQAFAIHLLISAVIFSALLIIITQYWFPGVFMQLGGWDGVKIVAGVDLILGPVLTLIVYNRTKKSLRVDLSIIAFIQFSCLIAGMWFVVQERPILQVLTHQHVKIITYREVTEHALDRQFIDTLGGSYPKKVFINYETKDAEFAELTGITTAFTQNKDISMVTEYYKEMSDEHFPDIKWQYDELEMNDALKCRWITIGSPHFQGEGCLSIKEGIIALRTEKKE